jgi:hypothetical protein
MIPDLKSTPEAIAYGKKIRGDQAAIDELKAERDRVYREAGMIDAKKNLTDAEFQLGFDLGFRAQMCREAYETAEGTLKCDFLSM